MNRITKLRCPLCRALTNKRDCLTDMFNHMELVHPEWITQGGKCNEA